MGEGLGGAVLCRRAREVEHEAAQGLVRVHAQIVTKILWGKGATYMEAALVAKVQPCRLMLLESSAPANAFMKSGSG